MAEHEAVQPATSLLSNKAYDWLKFIAQILLPGLGALYFAIAEIWHLPAAMQVVGTITAIDVFLGLFLSANNRAYKNTEAIASAATPEYDGDLVVDFTDPQKDIVQLQWGMDVYDIPGRDTVTLKVKKPTEVLEGPSQD